MSEDNQKNRLPLSSDETTAAGETARRLLEEKDADARTRSYNGFFGILLTVLLTFWAVFQIYVNTIGVMSSMVCGQQGAAGVEIELGVFLYHRSSPSFSGRTSVSASMPTSSMESSGSFVVRYCSHMPGADSARVSQLSWRPTSNVLCK